MSQHCTPKRQTHMPTASDPSNWTLDLHAAVACAHRDRAPPTLHGFSICGGGVFDAQHAAHHAYRRPHKVVDAHAKRLEMLVVSAQR